MGIAIFPEGTRIAPGQRGRYGIGGALLATRTGTPILPMAHNAGELWGRYAFRKRAGIVKVVLGPLIRTEGRDPHFREPRSGSLDRRRDAAHLARALWQPVTSSPGIRAALALGEGALEYVLVRRRGRRGVGLKVDETGLTVSAPSTMPLARIEALVRESERWVQRKIAEWRGRRVPDVSWGEGARAALPGGHASRCAWPRAAAARAPLAGDELSDRCAQRSSMRKMRRVVVGWYKRAAQPPRRSGCRRSRSRGDRAAEVPALLGHGAMGELQLGAGRCASRGAS